MKRKAGEKPRILFIVESLGGGVFTYIVDVTNDLVDEYEVFVAYGIRSQTPKDLQRYFDERIHLIQVKSFNRSINPVKDIKSFVEIRNIARSVKPDIIHLHSSKAGALGRIAFDGNKYKLFYTPHGYSFLMEDYTSVKRASFKLIETLCAKTKCTTISCSEGEHFETLKLTKRAEYVNNGINIEELDELVKDIEIEKDHPFTVFTLGRIAYQKNPELFNEIALSMPDVRFLWIGDGDMRDKLTAPNIEITGWVDRNEALKYSLNADVFVLTSLWEGLPISLLESMYIEKPCLVSDVIGNHDVIVNGENGYVCKTVQDYCRAIEDVKTCHEDVEKVVKKAHDDIINTYNTDNMVKEYKKLYSRYIRKAPEYEGDVKIIVAAHKKYRMPDDPMYVPIHVGAEGKFDENGKPLDLGYQKDNEGDNISLKNDNFCELTGLYWGWKHLDSDYLGLVHYRRHFAGSRHGDDMFERVLTYRGLKRKLKDYKVFVPQKRHYFIETLYTHYAHTHYEEHLNTTRDIIMEKYPDYLASYDRVLKRRYGYMFNMMIMQRDLIDDYCTWMFDILYELENRVNTSKLSFYQARLYGRVGEIIFNVWLDEQIRSGKLKESDVKELPIIHMEKINWFNKGVSFLRAKFLHQKYEGSF